MGWKTFGRAVLGTAIAVGFSSAALAQAQDLKIGMVVSLSGPGSSLGIPYERGMRAAVAAMPEVAGRKVQLIVLDDASDPSAAARNARKLIEDDKVDLLMGSAGTPMSVAMAQVGRDARTPMIGLTPLPLQGEDAAWAVTIPQPPQLMVSAVVERMKREGVKTVGFIGFSDSWGDLVHDALKRAADQAGIKVVANERYARADTSVTGQALRIVAARPDAVMNGGSGTPGALPYLALAERGYKGATYGNHGLINPDFVRVGGAAVEGTYLPTGPVIVAEQLPENYPTRKPALDFRAAFQKAHNAPSTDAFSAYSYDAYLVFADAARRALSAGGAQPGTPAFRQALRDAVYSTKEVMGTHAVYNFKPGSVYGVDERSRVVVQVSGGKWKLSQ